jgi:hypothetical protein
MSQQLAAAASYYKPVCPVSAECRRPLRNGNLDGRGLLALPVIPVPRCLVGVHTDTSTMQHIVRRWHTWDILIERTARSTTLSASVSLGTLSITTHEATAWRIDSSSPDVSFCSGCFLLCIKESAYKARSHCMVDYLQSSFIASLYKYACF